MKHSKKIKKILSLLFIGLIFAMLLSGLLNTLFFPDVVSEYENRYANLLDELSFSGYLDGSFQQSMDAALGDQVDLASTFKRLYNKVSSGIYRTLLQPFISSDDMKNNYYAMKSGWIFGGDCLVTYPYGEERMAALEHAAENYNRVFASRPEVEFFMYYVEREMDINFATGEKPGFSRHFFELLNLPADNKDAFSIDSFEQYYETFYRTDHHWNNIGSYQAYTELHKLLRCEDAPLCPTGERALGGKFNGSYARGDLSCYEEQFNAYSFDFPVMECRVDGNEIDNYGSQDYYLAVDMPMVSYGKFYGGDNGEVFYSSNRPERENLLIIGDSYDNALIRLIATHFNDTYAVDPRDYEIYMHKPFSLDYYIDSFGVDKVLFLGNIDTLSSREFYLGE